MVVVVAAATGLADSTSELIAVRRHERTAQASQRVANAGGKAADAELQRLENQLAVAEVTLAAARDRLAAAGSSLEASTAERDALVQELEAARGDLAATRGAVTNVEVQAGANNALVTSLGTCLDGVSTLLNQVALRDNVGAGRTIQAIAPACAEVGLVLG